MKRKYVGLALLLALLCVAASEPSVHKADQTNQLDSRIRKLTLKFEEMQQKPDKYIPAELLHNAQAIVLLDRTKAGFLFAFQSGSGIAMVKHPASGQWGPAGFVSANEASLGFQGGAQQSFIVMLFMTDSAARVLAQPNFEFGGEARGTAGDDSAGVSGTVSSHEQAMLVYDDRKGLFGGVAIKGGALSPDTDANFAYYGQALTMQDILFDNKVKPTVAASELAQTIARAETAPPPSPSVAKNALRYKTARSPLKGAQQLVALTAAATPAYTFAPQPESTIATASATTTAGTVAQPTMLSDTAGQQLQLLLSDLSTHKQTNALSHLNAYLSAMTTTMQTADAATTLLILQRLRDGNSREAIDLLESRLDGSLIALSASLNAMPRAKRPPQSLELLRQVRDYRERYPRHTENPDIDKQVAQVWNLLENN